MTKMDEKSKKQLILVAALLPVLGFLLLQNVVGPHMKRQAERRMASTQAAAKDIIPAAPGQPVMGREERLAKVDEFRQMEWGTNPFLEIGRPRRPDAPAPAHRSASPAPAFKLEGIVADDGIPYAIIDGELRQPGDWIGQFEVFSITAEQVVLKRGDETVVLSLFSTDGW